MNHLCLTKWIRLAGRPSTLLLSTSALLLSGCAGTVPFGSATPLGAGVLGKNWQIPVFVDSDLYIPAAQAPSVTAGEGLIRDFAAANSGDQLQLIGSWWDSSTPAPFKFRGYARSYKDGEGWAALGPEFSQVAAATADLVAPFTDSFYMTSLGIGPGGLFMAAFITPGEISSASYSSAGAVWQRYLNTNGLSNAPASTYRPSASVMDSLGRGYQFYASATRLYETPWALADPAGVSITAHDASQTDLATYTHITARFDGVSQVCATFESSIEGLHASCENVACAAPFNFTATTTIDTGVIGHDSATDGLGNIIVVYYKGTHVFAKRGTGNGACGGASETWSAELQLDDDVNIGSYVAASSDTTAFPNKSRPGVAYLGGGRFMAAWIGVSPLAKTTRIFATVYDPNNGGWQKSTTEAPDSLQYMTLNPESTFDNYTAIAHAQTLSVFSNGAGNAGIAISTIVATNSDSIYPEDAHVRSIAVNRWQQDVGWVGLINWGPHIENGLSTTPGTTCYNLIVDAGAGPASGDGADCTHPPVGVILPSGTSLVFFQAQDNYPQPVGTNGDVTPGNRRLAVTEFK